MTTDRYKSLRELTDKQRTAIDALVTGATHSEAAERAGVHRVTVTNWVARHPAFQAEFNRRRRELSEQRTARLRELDAAALDAIAGKVHNPDFALKWLKLRGLHASLSVDTGPTDASWIIEQLVEARVAKVRAAGNNQVLESLDGVDRVRIRADVLAELAADVATTHDS